MQEIIEEDWEQNTYLLILLGGRDLCYMQKLQGKGNRKIQNYLKNGGNFLGICAGSYYSGNYVEFAKGTNIEITGKQELEIFKGTVKGVILARYYYNSNIKEQKLLTLKHEFRIRISDLSPYTW